MNIDWWTVALQTLNVVILIWILAHFLFRPVSRIIAERQQAARAALDVARAEAAAAEAARQQAEDDKAAVAAQRSALIAKATDEAAAEKARILDTARAEVDRLRQSEKAEMDRMREAEADTLADQASRLATDITERLLRRLPDTARTGGFDEGLVQAVAGLPESTRAGIGAHGPVRLRAAQALSDAAEARLTLALSNELGRPVSLAITVDPALIAGLELDTPHAVVANHFRADLDHITESLTRHG